MFDMVRTWCEIRELSSVRHMDPYLFLMPAIVSGYFYGGIHFTPDFCIIYFRLLKNRRRTKLAIKISITDFFRHPFFTMISDDTSITSWIAVDIQIDDVSTTRYRNISDTLYSFQRITNFSISSSFSDGEQANIPSASRPTSCSPSSQTNTLRKMYIPAETHPRSQTRDDPSAHYASYLHYLRDIYTEVVTYTKNSNNHIKQQGDKLYHQFKDIPSESLDTILLDRVYPALHNRKSQFPKQFHSSYFALDYSYYNYPGSDPGSLNLIPPPLTKYEQLIWKKAIARVVEQLSFAERNHSILQYLESQTRMFQDKRNQICYYLHVNPTPPTPSLLDVSLMNSLPLPPSAPSLVYLPNMIPLRNSQQLSLPPLFVHSLPPSATLSLSPPSLLLMQPFSSSSSSIAHGHSFTASSPSLSQTFSNTNSSLSLGMSFTVPEEAHQKNKQTLQFIEVLLTSGTLDAQVCALPLPAVDNSFTIPSIYHCYAQLLGQFTKERKLDQVFRTMEQTRTNKQQERSLTTRH